MSELLQQKIQRLEEKELVLKSSGPQMMDMTMRLVNMSQIPAFHIIPHARLLQEKSLHSKDILMHHRHTGKYQMTTLTKT